MAFRLSADVGDQKPDLRLEATAPGALPVEAVIDHENIDREHACRLLRLMAEHLLEGNWPPDPVRGNSVTSRSRRLI